MRLRGRNLPYIREEKSLGHQLQAYLTNPKIAIVLNTLESSTVRSTLHYNAWTERLEDVSASYENGMIIIYIVSFGWFEYNWNWQLTYNEVRKELDWKFLDSTLKRILEPSNICN